MTSATKLNIAICGGGIGGLTCALALSKYPDIQIEVFEAAQTFAEVGAGVGVWPRPWKILRFLGLDHDLLQTTETKPMLGPVKAFEYRKSDQPVGLPFYTMYTEGSLLTFHRPDFQKVILQHLPKSCRTYMSKRLRSYSQAPGGPITLLFEDGTTFNCDVLLGADGLKSSTRRSLLREKARWAHGEGRVQESANIMSCVDPVWSGTNAYRAAIPAEELRARAPNHRVLTQPVQYLGKNGFVIAYPIACGRLINIAAFDMHHDLENTVFPGSWVCPAQRSEFLGRFTHWEPEVHALLDCVETPLRWAVHIVKPLGSFISGRVALLGDAAHAMTPHQGSGAGQAIEDAYMLSILLGHPSTTRRTAARALSVYDHIRRPAAQMVARRSRYNGQLFTFHVEGGGPSPIDHLAGDELIRSLRELGETFRHNWEWSWATEVDSDLKEAMRMLESA